MAIQRAMTASWTEPLEDDATVVVLAITQNAALSQ